MKKLLLFLLLPLSILIVSSCDSTNDPVTPTPQGNLFVTSNPAGAQIWIDGSDTGQLTPDTVMNIDEGSHQVTLKLQDYTDTTFTVSVTSGQTFVVTNVNLVSTINTTLFGPVRIYETQGTSSSQPSGLDLSSGMSYGVSSADADSVDIYYSTSGTGGDPFLVQSAHLYPQLFRETDFLVGSASNLFDGEDSPNRNTGSGTWTNNMDDRESNYVFLYDHDAHYSKILIVNSGGGVPGEPAWVEIQWYYNNVRQDERFD